MNNYDIVDHKNDLRLLDDVEPNLVRMPCNSINYELVNINRTINPDDDWLDVLELYQGDNLVIVSKEDIEAMAKHFGLLKKIHLEEDDGR